MIVNDNTIIEEIKEDEQVGGGSRNDNSGVIILSSSISNHHFRNHSDDDDNNDVDDHYLIKDYSRVEEKIDSADTSIVTSPIHQPNFDNVIRHRDNAVTDEDEITEGLVSSKEIELEDNLKEGHIQNNAENNSVVNSSPIPTLAEDILYQHHNISRNDNSLATTPFKRYLDKRLFKLITLVFLIANLGFGTFFSYTSAQSLSYTFYQTFSINSSQYSSLFTLYAIPNICMVFISGMLVDIYGPDRISIILSSIVFISTLIGALSPPHYSIMLLSRFMLGFAGESLVSCSNALMTKWIPDRNLSICLGFLVGWIYFANLNSFLILPAINKSFGFRISLWVVFFVQLLCLSLNILYLIFKKYFKEISKDKEMDILLTNLEYNNDIDLDKSIDDYVFLQKQQDDQTIKKSLKQKLSGSMETIKDILKQIPVRMWIIFGIVFFGYSSMYGFAIIGPDFFGQKYGFDEQIASLILSSETICSSVLSPLFGIAIKYIGKRITFLVIAMILLASGLFLFVVTPATIHPLPWIIMCGTGFALLNTTVYASLPIFIPDQVLGTCFGFIGTGYNLGLIVFSPILGSLKVASGNYNSSIYLLFGSCLITLSLIVVLKFLDIKSIKQLDK